MIEQTPVLNIENGKSKPGSAIIELEGRQSLPKTATTFSEAMLKAGKPVEEAPSEKKLPFSEIQVDVATAQPGEKVVDSNSEKLLQVDADTQIDLEAVLEQINNHSGAKGKSKAGEVAQTVLNAESKVEETFNPLPESEVLPDTITQEQDSQLSPVPEEAEAEAPAHEEAEVDHVISVESDLIDDAQGMVVNTQADNIASVDEANNKVVNPLNAENMAHTQMESSLAEDVSDQIEINETIEGKETSLNSSMLDSQKMSLDTNSPETSGHVSQSGMIHGQSSQSSSENKAAESTGYNPMKMADKTDEKAQDARVLVADEKPRGATNKDSNIPPVNELKHSKSDSTSQVGNAANSSGQSGANHGQSSQQNSQNQQFSQQQQQMLNQLQKQQISQQHQEIVKSFNDALSVEEQKTEKTEKILGNLGVSFDSRNQLPAGLQAITQGVRTPQWSQALGHRVTYMANNKIQEAKISLNPEKLGPIQVKLSIDKDQHVHVSMAAQHGTTREAIENAMPRLREMLEAAGISFGSLDVKDERAFSENQNENHQKQQGTAGTGAAELNSDVEEEHVMVHSSSNNLVDYYA